MTKRPPQESLIDSPKVFARVLKRARDEGWTQLALIRDEREWSWLEENGWETKTSFVVRAQLFNLLDELSTVTGITSLYLGSRSIGDDGARVIAKHLISLTSLHLDGNSIGVDGARAIAENLTGLTSLYLGSNSIGDDGARAIAENLTGLTSLDLAFNSIGVDGARAIAENLTGLTSLNLAFNSIDDDGARAIAENLTGLTSLDLSRNSIGDDGARAIAENLTGLTSLNLNRNSIGVAGARAMAENLTGLTSLDLALNSIGVAGARAIAENLTGLTSLYLGSNGIGDDGARAIAENLTGLTSLFVGSNDIGDDGARAIAEHLTGLTSLNLGSNDIGDDGARAITEHLTGLAFLDLDSNHIESFSSELLKLRDGRAILASTQRFQSSTNTPLNEAKLLVLGNEAVGKTSLIRYLMHNQPRDPDEKKTPGVEVHEKIETLTWSPNKDGPRLNVWDFGGQEIMHETHKFFLTQRSIYLLVLEDRREDDTSIYNWLRTIANRGGDSPVVVVINKCDDGKPKLLLDETNLRREWPTIVGFLRTSCNSTDRARDSIRDLKTTIASLLAEDPRLKRVRDPFPVAWRRVKDTVADLAKRAKVLDHLAFIRLCESSKDAGDAITNPDEQRGLLGVLHELGAIVAHGLSPNAPAALQQIKLLDPNWLTGAVYKVLNAAMLVHQGGVFKREQLAELLDPTDYPPERWEFVLSLMQLDGVGLCFPLRNSANAYLVPEALPRSEPHYDNWPQDSLRFRYEYEFLPAGLIPRFIVEAHPRLTNTRWREGAVLEATGCSVLVRGSRDRRRIDILVDGPKPRRRSALEVVRADLIRVHELNPESKPTARVPLPDNPEVSVSYQHLLDLEELKGSAYEYIPDGTRSSYRVGDLLDGVREYSSARQSPTTSDSSPTETQFRRLQRDYTGVWGLKVFALAIVTLAPLYINFKSLDLKFSVATTVYVSYHIVAIYCWAKIRQLTHQPDLFRGDERDAEIQTIAKDARTAGYLGWAVSFVIIMTVIAIGSLGWGNTQIKAPLPSFVYKALGVPEG